MKKKHIKCVKTMNERYNLRERRKEKLFYRRRRTYIHTNTLIFNNTHTIYSDSNFIFARYLIFIMR